AFVLAPLTILGGWQWFANRRQVPKSVRLWIPAVVLSVIVVAVSVGAYNWMTLGSPLHLPYAEYEKQYGLVPVFWPLPLRNEIQFDDPTIEDSIEKHQSATTEGRMP